MNGLDLDLLQAVINNEGEDGCSTWELARQFAENPYDNPEIKKLDQKIRYHMEKLEDAGLLESKKTKRGTRSYKRYYPAKTTVLLTGETDQETMKTPIYAVCSQGALWLLQDPLTVQRCPYKTECGGCDNIDLFPDECLLYNRSNDIVKTLIDAFIKVPRNTLEPLDE